MIKPNPTTRPKVRGGLSLILTSLTSLTLLTFLTLFTVNSSSAQTYETLRDSGLRAYDALKFEDAIVQFEAAEVLAEGGQLTEVDSLIDWAKDGYIREIIKAKVESEREKLYAQAQTLVFQMNDLPSNYDERILRILGEKWRQLEEKGVEPSPALQRKIAQPIYDQLKGMEHAPHPLSELTLEHGGEILAATFSPDGKTILTRSSDGRAKIWKSDGTLVAELDREICPVYTAKFAPDGQCILTGSYDSEKMAPDAPGMKPAKLWDLKGNLLTDLDQGTGASRLISFSPNGQFILTGSWGPNAYLWDLGGKLMANITCSDYLISADFSPDGQRILTSSSDGTVALWGLDGNLVTKWKTQEKSGASARFSPEGDKILTGWSGKNNLMNLWSLKGKCLNSWECNSHDAFVDAVYSPDGQFILTASEMGVAELRNKMGELICLLGEAPSEIIPTNSFSPKGDLILTKPISASKATTVSIWNTEGKLLAQLENGDQPVHSFSWSPDGKQILTRSSQSVKLWDVEGHLLAVFDKHSSSISFSVFGPDGQSVLTGSRDGMVKIWRPKTMLAVNLEKHSGMLNSLAFSPDSKYILTSAEDSTAKLWDLEGKLLLDQKIQTSPIQSANFSPDGIRILVEAPNPWEGSVMGREVQLWDLTGRVKTNFEQELGGILEVTFSPDGRSILTCSSDSTVKLWDLEGNLLRVFEASGDLVTHAMFSPDGLALLTLSDAASVKLWDLDGNLLGEINQDSYAADQVRLAHANKHVFLFSPDGQHLLVRTSWQQSSTFEPYPAGPEVSLLWKIDADSLILLKGHSDGIYSALYSPDGTRILTTSQDGTAILWNLNGQVLAELKGHDAAVFSASFSPDGRTILTNSQDGTAKLWDLSGELLVNFDTEGGYNFFSIFSPDATRILTQSRLSEVKLWDLTGTLLADFGRVSSPLSLDANIFSSDGRYMLLDSKLWDFQGRLLAERDNAGSPSIFSPDGRYILSRDSNYSAQLWPTPRTVYEWLQSPECPIPPLTKEERLQYNLPAED